MASLQMSRLLLMYLPRAIGINLNGEKLLGLVDGTQAIVLTLLVINLPDLFVDAIENISHASTLAFVLVTDLVGYLIAALIVFDIWSLQKAAIGSSKPSNFQSLMCIATLWLSSLIPVFFFLTEKFAQAGFKDIQGFTGEPQFTEIVLFRSILLLVIGSIYFIIYLYIARCSVFKDWKEAHFVRELSKFRSTALAFILAISLLIAMFFRIALPLIPLVAFAPTLWIVPKATRMSEP